MSRNATGESNCGYELGAALLAVFVHLKYELGVIPKAFLNMKVKALGVL